MDAQGGRLVNRTTGSFCLTGRSLSNARADMACMFGGPRVLVSTIQTQALGGDVRMWRFTKNNGITEGFHTKMEMISRRAFGFRNFDNYRLRVRVMCA